MRYRESLTSPELVARLEENEKWKQAEQFKEEKKDNKKRTAETGGKTAEKTKKTDPENAPPEPSLDIESLCYSIQ